MAIPQSAYPAPFNITRASHVVLRVRDLAKSRAFYVDALGLVVSAEENNTLYLRGVEEACHHSLVLKQSDAAAAERVGLRVYNDDELARAKSWFDAQGLPAAYVDVPHQGRTLHVSDAVGTPLEICATMDVKPRLVVKFEQFVSGAPQRIDHFQMTTPHVQKACAFYASLGFRLSEYIAIDNTDDLVFVFLQRKGNPHDIVFANGPGPRLHHMAFCVADAAALIKICDVAGNLGFGGRLEFGPGRHGPGHALFVYLRDPDGHRVEFFTTHYQIMDIENEPVRWDASYMKNRPWGMPPRASWYEEAMPFAGVAIEPPARRGDPLTLEKYLGAANAG